MGVGRPWGGHAKTEKQEACRRSKVGVCREETASFGACSSRVSVDDDGWVEFIYDL